MKKIIAAFVIAVASLAFLASPASAAPKCINCLAGGGVRPGGSYGPNLPQRRTAVGVPFYATINGRLNICQTYYYYQLDEWKTECTPLMSSGWNIWNWN